MIFYTLQGPGYKLEIHENKILLLKKSWLQVLTKNVPAEAWEIQELSRFEITVPKLFWGKLAWESFDGNNGTFRFTTTPAMVKKIESYLQKRILKNHQKLVAMQAAKKEEATVQNLSKAERKRTRREAREAA